MRSSDPLRRLLCPSTSGFWTRSRAVQLQCRCLHSSQRLQESRPERSKRNKPYDHSKPYTNHLIPQNELKVRHAKQKKRYQPRSRRGLLQYTAEELEAMKEKYTPQQMAAIMAGEQNISDQDIADQAVLHQGPMTLDYLDDFSQHRPVVDKNPETPGLRNPKTGKLPKFRWKSDEELVEDVDEWVGKQPDDGGSEENWQQFLLDHKLYESEGDVDLEGARSFVAPEIFPIDDPILQAQARASTAKAGKTDELQEGYEALAKQTGFSVEEMKRFRVKFLVTRFVVNQTRLGKARSLYLMTVAGNGKGMLGVGEAKSQLANEARKKATLDAIRNMVPIRRYEDRTIYGNVKGKSGATELELFSRGPGFGSRGQSLIWEMCKMAGIKDISARVTRSRNPMNIVKAAFSALRSQRDPEEIAMGRGRRMVDLRKVYYAGSNA